MEKFLNSGKSDTNYLEQLQENVDEKSGLLIESLNSGHLPRFGGTTRVLEVGIGGGDGIEKIKNEVKDPDLQVFGVDIIDVLAKRINNPERNIFGVVADIAQPPFAERSMSAINLSSVVHEGISYNKNIIEGDLDIDTYLKEMFSKLFNLLETDGVLFYRDIGLPNNAREQISGNYSNKVSAFVRNFHEQFSKTFNNLTNNESGLELVPGVDSIQLQAPVHYHREIQRHLISYLDLAMRQKVGKSFKSILKSLDGGEETQEHFDSVLSSVIDDSMIFDSWYNREGSEMYTYRSIIELSKLLDDSLGAENYESKDSFLIKRKAYSSFIDSQTDTRLSDTKQIMVVKRTK